MIGFPQNSLMFLRGILLPHMVPMVMSELEVQDIDNPDDWEIAELKYRMMVEPPLISAATPRGWRLPRTAYTPSYRPTDRRESENIRYHSSPKDCLR